VFDVKLQEEIKLEVAIAELSKIKALCADLLRAPDFVKISLAQNKPNIFRALSLQDNEIRHSNFLAYLLDPLETHGLGDQFLRPFLADIFEGTDQGRDFFFAAEIDLRQAEIRREWKHIDLTVVLPQDVVVIENKVNAQEGKGQLKKYALVAKEEFPKRKVHLVFLTKEGRASSDEDMASQYFSYGYSVIVSRIRELVDRLGAEHNTKVVSYLNDYVDMMEEDVLMNTKENELAQRIYATHKEALDFIFLNRPDLAEKFSSYFADAVKENGFILGSANKGYIRFTT
jgi:hypothetical protein